MKDANIKSISFAKGLMTVGFDDGRKVSVPLEYCPRLLNGTTKQRSQWEIIGAGRGIHWPDLDEHLSIEGILHGIPSVEYRKPTRRTQSKASSHEVRI